MFYCSNNNFNFNPSNSCTFTFQSSPNHFLFSRKVTVVNPYIQIAMYQQVRAMEQMILVNYLAKLLLINALIQNFQSKNLKQNSTRFSCRNSTSSSSKSYQYSAKEEPKSSYSNNTSQQNFPRSSYNAKEQPKSSYSNNTSRSSVSQNNSPILATSSLTVEEAKLCQNYKNEFLQKVGIENPEKVPFSKVNSAFNKQCLKKKWHSDKNKTSDTQFVEANEKKDQYLKKMQPYAETIKGGPNIVLDTKILAELDSYFKL